MMAELIANTPSPGTASAITQLNGAITSGATTFVTDQAAPAALQGGQFRILIDAEWMLVTGGQNGTTWTVTRGIEGSSAAAHLDNSLVYHVWTAAGITAAFISNVPLTGAAWVAPSLTNSWVNLGAPYETAGYLKDRFGFVHLKGAISTGASSTTAFTLPAGYRPGATGYYPVVTSSFVFGALYIDTSGLVQPNGANSGVSTFMSGTKFLAEN